MAKRSAALAVVISLALATWGCGSSDDGGGGEDAVAVDTWARDFCNSFAAWVTDIRKVSDGVDEDVPDGDVEAAKTAIIGLFGQASELTQQLVEDVDDGGVPDIADGDQLVDDITTRFEQFDDAILAAQSQAEDLPTDDPDEFKSEVDTLVETYQREIDKAGDTFAELDAKYPSRGLADAMSEHCDFS